MTESARRSGQCLTTMLYATISNRYIATLLDSSQPF